VEKTKELRSVFLSERGHVRTGVNPKIPHKIKGEKGLVSNGQVKNMLSQGVALRGTKLMDNFAP